MYNNANLSGYFALFIWSTSALFAGFLVHIPPFQFLTVTLGLSFVTACILITIKGQWRLVYNQPIVYWVIGILGIYGNDFLYIASSKFAPIAHVGLLNYLWPIFIILLNFLFIQRKSNPKDLFAVLISFSGLFIICLPSLASFNFQYIKGYALSVTGALIWSIYNLSSRRFKSAPPEIIGIFCGAGALFSFAMHMQYEQFVTPAAFDWIWLIIMGVFNQGGAYILWDRGIKYGDYKFLTVMSYGNPILMTIWLVLSNLAEFDVSILLATCCLVIGGLLSKPKS